MVLRSVTDQAIQAHLQGKVHKKRMQDNDPWQDYECDCGRKLERVKAFQIKQHHGKHPDWVRTSSHRGLVGDNLNPRTAGPCLVKDANLYLRWMAGRQDAEAVLLEVPTLRYEAGDFSVWDDNGFGMLSPFGVRIDNAAMLDFDSDSECASDPDSNFASDPEDSSDQDVPASEIARESPENDTTCEYHGLLQAAEDTDQLLFVAFEGRRIHVQQLLNIVVNSDLQAATQNYHRLLRNQQPASPQAILTTPQKSDRVQPFDIFCTLVNYNDKKCSIGFFSLVKVMHAGRQTFPALQNWKAVPMKSTANSCPLRFWVMLALSIGMGVSCKRCTVFVLLTHISLHQLQRWRGCGSSR